MKTGARGIICVAIAMLGTLAIFLPLLDATRKSFEELSGKQGQLQREFAEKSFAEGQDHLTQGNLDLAIACFTDALRHNPVHQMALLSRGHTLLKKRDFPRAADDFSKLIEKEPGNHFALVGRAAALCKLNKHQQAIQDCDLALTQKKDGLAFAIRGEAWFSLGEAGKALVDLNTAITLGQKGGRPFACRCLIHLQQNRAREASLDLLVVILAGAETW